MRTLKTIIGSVLAVLLAAGAIQASNTISAKDQVSVGVERQRAADNEVKVIGRYQVDHVRDGKVIHSEVGNTVTTQGKRYLLDAALDNSAGGFTEKTTWYVALVSTNTAAAATYVYDTFLDGATVPATEFVSYAGGVRPTWNGVIDGSAASITNSASRASFAITGSGTLYGACLVSNSTLSDHTAGDWLFSYALFASPIAVVNTDTVNITITITLT